MNNPNTLLVACIAVGIIAFFGGIILGQRRGTSGKVQRELERQLGEMQQQQQSYQSEVTEHFMETAQLLDQLTNSYRDVHNHLAQGAHLLAGEAVGKTLDMLPENPSREQSTLEAGVISPPLDYAPKSTPHDKGMLNEEFGLDSVKSDDDVA